MNSKKITQLSIVFFIALLTFSCNKDNSLPVDGTISLKAKATLNNTALKNSLATKSQSAINISTFKINIQKIEFDIKDNDTINEDLYSDLELNGPFELDLSSGNATVDITSINLPTNVYEKIQFELDKSTNTQSDLFGKSIEITGDINGTPFVFWSDAEEEVKVDFNNVNLDIVMDGLATSTTINFDLSAIFGATSTIDFSTAVDGNQNGVIEINPNNDDGNGELADILKDLIEEGSELEND